MFKVFKNYSAFDKLIQKICSRHTLPWYSNLLPVQCSCIEKMENDSIRPFSHWRSFCYSLGQSFFLFGTNSNVTYIIYYWLCMLIITPGDLFGSLVCFPFPCWPAVIKFPANVKRWWGHTVLHCTAHQSMKIGSALQYGVEQCYFRFCLKFLSSCDSSCFTLSLLFT